VTGLVASDLNLPVAVAVDSASNVFMGGTFNFAIKESLTGT
jgi:hypothetical protein